MIPSHKWFPSSLQDRAAWFAGMDKKEAYKKAAETAGYLRKLWCCVDRSLPDTDIGQTRIR